MPAHYEIRRAADRYFVQLHSGDGEALLTSDVQDTKGGAEYAIVRLRKYAPIDSCYERRMTGIGFTYFILKSRSGQVLARSPLYTSLAARELAIVLTRCHGEAAPLHDST